MKRNAYPLIYPFLHLHHIKMKSQTNKTDKPRRHLPSISSQLNQHPFLSPQQLTRDDLTQTLHSPQWILIPLQFIKSPTKTQSNQVQFCTSKQLIPQQINLQNPRRTGRIRKRRSKTNVLDAGRGRPRRSIRPQHARAISVPFNSISLFLYQSFLQIPFVIES